MSEDLIEVDDLVHMRRVLRALVMASEVPTSALEKVAGLPDGYIPKILSEKPSRGLSGNSIFLLAAVVGRKVALIPDPTGFARVRAHHEYVVATRRNRVFGERYADAVSMLKKIGQRTGRLSAPARMKKMTPAERSRVARLAARARWDRQRSSGIP